MALLKPLVEPKLGYAQTDKVDGLLHNFLWSIAVTSQNFVSGKEPSDKDTTTAGKKTS
jgi:hypothetical protein